MSWVEVELGKLATFTMGQAPSGQNINSNGVGTPFYRSGEFAEIRPISNVWTTTPLRAAKSSDVLVCVVGAYAGQVNLGVEGAIGRSVAAISPGPELDQHFLYYFLKSQEIFLRNASQGSVQSVISKEDLARLPIPLPPMEIQKKISQKLWALDSKIESNERLVDLAFQLMKAIYSKSTKRELVSATELLTPVLGGTPSRSVASYWGGEIPWASAKDVASSRFSILQTAESITQEGVKQSAAKILPAGTIVITARGTVGAITRLGSPMAFNQSCYGLLPRGEINETSLFLGLLDAVQRIQNAGHGTVFNTINMASFEEIKIDWPTIDPTDQQHIDSLWNLCSSRECENNLLRNIRLNQLKQDFLKLTKELQKELT